MKKRFLHVCKNPLCGKEFAIVHDKSAKFSLSMMFRCPHCKKMQKVDLPAGKKAEKRKKK